MTSFDVYSLLLRLYPRRFRTQFAEEMKLVFRQTLAERGQRSLAGDLRFVTRELVALSAGWLREWGRCMLSPNGAEQTALADFQVDDECALPVRIREAERYIELASKTVIHAIANHQFGSARSCDRKEQRVRELLATWRTQG